MTEKKDIYQRITDRIVEALARGVRPWAQPWQTVHLEGRITRPLRHNGERYNGINIVMLWMSAAEAGHISPYWMTFQQALKLDAAVRKGERGTPVVYANKFTKQEERDGQEVDVEIPFMKGYTVFNACQIDGLPAHFYEAPARNGDIPARIEMADKFFSATKAEIVHHGMRACYNVQTDRITMPPLACFARAEDYYAVLAHEVTHWTRHPIRLDRSFGRKRFGDEGYAREELVAELGAAFLSADLDLSLTPREDHASYIASWLKVLKNDKRAVFSAAAHAQRATAYLHDLQDESEP